MRGCLRDAHESQKETDSLSIEFAAAVPGVLCAGWREVRGMRAYSESSQSAVFGSLSLSLSLSLFSSRRLRDGVNDDESREKEEEDRAHSEKRSEERVLASFPFLLFAPARGKR